MKSTDPQIKIRRSAERGRADLGWLDSRHTFSFGHYQDPGHMGFRSLRVINQDVVAPSGGFPTHPHRDMEIFSYVLSGSLSHQDSMGNGRELKPGQIQLMSAGSGVSHSEFNPSATEPLHFLQIWIQPSVSGLPPSYTEWHPTAETEDSAKVLVISSDGREGSATIHQDADVFRLRLKAGETARHELRPGRGVWIQLIAGSMEACGAELTAGDALCTETPGEIAFRATADCEVLLFDLA